MKITFFNHFHNGDLHLSRGFVRAIMSAHPEHEYAYAHPKEPHLLSDIPNLKYQQHIPLKEYEGIKEINEVIYVNTWYGQQHGRFMDKLGVTFDTLYCIFDDVWTQILCQVQSDNPANQFPSIDYSKFECRHANEWLGQHWEKKVLVENGLSLSGQSVNFDMNQVVVKLALAHTDIAFLTSQPIANAPPNVYSCGSIIKKSGSDLNEISYLSTHCDIIIGRASGVFSFCMTKDNLFLNNKTFLCFSNLDRPKFWLGDMFDKTIDYTATVMNYTATDLDKVQNLIEFHL